LPFPLALKAHALVICNVDGSHDSLKVYLFWPWQVAVRAGGFSALIVVGMTVMGVAVLFASFYVLLGVDTVGNMKMTECELSAFLLSNFLHPICIFWVKGC